MTIYRGVTTTIYRGVTTLLVLHLITTVAINLYGDDPSNGVGSPDLRGNTASARQTDSTVESNETGEPQQSHPLMPTLQLAREGYQRINDDVHDYTCVLVKREQVNGKLLGPERIFAKVRHERVVEGEVVSPFSVYMKFQEPDESRGREVLFVSGRNDDKFLVRKGGSRLAFLTVSLKPTSMMAMAGNRYPITEFGIKRLTQRMIELGNKELAYQECEVVIHDDIKLSDQVCTSIEVRHPIRRQYFAYNVARIYIDNQLRVPIRFESYDWPASGSDVPVLKEEYTYCDMKLNVGLTDADFEPSNPAYGFR